MEVIGGTTVKAPGEVYYFEGPIHHREFPDFWPRKTLAIILSVFRRGGFGVFEK